MTDDRKAQSDPAPESAMGGAGDAGAHGRHPASHPAASSRPEPAIGDAAIERRHHRDDDRYDGPERRQGRQRQASA
jgi:hypothetical protein